jgi:hypothetical protein
MVCSKCKDIGWYDDGDAESGPSPHVCNCTAGLIKGLVMEGMAANWDEAVHMLVDMGEIDSEEHKHYLSPDESKRVYG